MKNFSKRFCAKSPFKSSYLSGSSVTDSVNRGNINSNIRILPDKEETSMTDRHGNKLKKYVPGVDGPEYYGGTLPVSRMGQIVDVLKFGYKNLFPGG
tara:strand:+ start:157 stop:447 length:291 start_codon:yes stop_codon:yes gene_type:complete